MFSNKKIEWRQGEKIIDEINNSVIAQHVDYGTDIKPIGLGTRSLKDYKIWLKIDSCEKTGDRNFLDQFNKLKQRIKHINE